MDDLELLVALASKSGLYGSYTFTTTSLARLLHGTQQTISRRLILLEREGLIRRSASTQGISISLTAAGIDRLSRLHEQVAPLFDTIPSITGTLITGLGEGRYYVRIYNRHFQRHLGITAYAGTLNLKVDPARSRAFLLQLERVVIKGFRSASRDFGDVECFPVLVYRQPAALIRPMRTSHPDDVIEIIWATNLRKRYRIREGQAVEVRAPPR